MAESSSHKSPSPKTKEELVTLDKLESPNPFLPATQVDFTFDEIAFTTNNEVALIYPSHRNQDYFMSVSDFISKCCLKEAFTRALTQYKEYLSELWSNPNVVDKSKSARDGLKTVHTESRASKELGADKISKKIKLEDLADLLKDTRSAFFTPDSPPDEPINVSYESDQEEVKKAKETPATSQDVPEDTSVAELKNTKWELQAEFLDLLHLASSIQEKLKTLDSLTATGVPLEDKAVASLAKGEKDTDINLKNELVDLLGIDIVTQYYNKKLLYERYCDKIKKRRQSSKIINCDVLTKKGLISLKVYREDGTAEVIEKFKASDLQLAEWKKIVQACPDR
nr:hypothetical protein [Tanacetum cinerariifolium]